MDSEWNKCNYGAAVSELDEVLEKISKVPGSILPSDDEILQEIREICNGLALSDRARAARYDKIVEILKEKNNVH